MRTGIIIICRYNSNRLPGKILKLIEGKPIIEYIVENVITITDKENIVIATSNESTDDPIAEFCKQNNLNIYRGSLNNVAERFLKCAEEYKMDYCTRINGDNIFVDTKILNQMLTIASDGKYDFVSNVKDRTFPKGMSIEIVKTSYYKKIYQKFSDPGHFEHVTQYLYQNEEPEKYYYYRNTECPEAAGIQLAIDTIDDFELATKMISRFKHNHTSYGLQDIYNLYKEFTS